MPGILCVFNMQTSSSTNNFYSYCERYGTARNSKSPTHSTRRRRLQQEKVMLSSKVSKGAITSKCQLEQQLTIISLSHISCCVCKESKNNDPRKVLVVLICAKVQIRNRNSLCVIKPSKSSLSFFHY